MLKSLLCVLTLVLLTAAGCGGRPEVEVDPAKTDSAKTAPKKENKAVAKQPAIERSTMEGNWVIQFNQFAQNGYSAAYVTAGLLQIARADDGKSLTAKLLKSPVPGIQIHSQEITDRTAKILLVAKQRDEQLTVDLDVRLDKTQAIGTAALMGQLQPSRLVATNDDDLKNWPPQREHDSIGDYRSAMQEYNTLKKTEAAEKFIREQQRDPLAYVVVLAIDPTRRPDSKPTEEQLKSYLELQRKTLAYWGPRAYQTAQVLHVGALANRGLFPDYTLKLIQELEASDEPYPIRDPYRIQLEANKVVVSGEIAMTTTDAAKRATAVKLLKEMLQQNNRFNVRQTYALAVAAEKAGDQDAAIDWLATLVALPTMAPELEATRKQRGEETPDLKKKLEELWKKKHGSDKGLTEFLTTKYEGAINGLTAALPVLARKPTPKHIRLCELFTGSDHPGCVAVDIALKAIQREFPQELIVLRYELDTPKPGPLVCSDSKNRAFDVQAVNPPAVFINGSPAVNVAGTMTRSPQVHGFLRDVIFRFPPNTDPKTKCSLTMSAERSGDTVTISSNVDAAKEGSEDLRLRVVLAEDYIDFKGDSGIRRHEMVVRSMPSGIDGVPLKDGKVAWKKTVDLKQLRRQLLDFLTSYEERLDLKLPTKPVDLKDIHLVAFVQSKRTMQILAVTSVHLKSGGEEPSKKTPSTSPAGK